ncbi:MAG: hypothetical protein A3J74_03895, partial [Elusimicrobia bacterium RIFCSPHIGHO2_02_FULL_57_9]
LGGGFAGLSCAAALAEAGRRVTLIEKKPHLGGRAYSFLDPQSGQTVDNGQHLFLGCYRQTRKFLARIGTESLLKFQKKIRVDFADAQGRRDVLSCPAGLGSPWHLAWGVLRLKGLSLSDKWGLIRLERYMRKMNGEGVAAALDALTVRQWLGRLGQSQRIQERLFDPIAVGALNDDPAVAAATGLAQVLREVFFRDVESARLGLSTVGLSDLYTGAARSFIEARGGRVLLARKISGLIEEEGRVIGVAAQSGEKFPAAAVVSTLAPWDLARLDLPRALRGAWRDLKPAPIISVCFWLDRPVLGAQPLVGMLGTEIQWVFNKSLIFSQNARPMISTAARQYLSLVISGAHRHVSLDPQAIKARAESDMARCFPEFPKASILRWKVIKEPFATLSPVPGSDALRPRHESGVPGFYFAGDWTQTGLPATIESAVVSGHRAADIILRSLE